MAKTRIAIAIAAATALAALTAAPAPAAGEGKPKLRTLSTRADLVTGGDVLVAVDVPRAADAGKVRVRRNGRRRDGRVRAGRRRPEAPRRARRRPPRRGQPAHGLVAGSVGRGEPRRLQQPRHRPRLLRSAAGAVLLPHRRAGPRSPHRRELLGPRAGRLVLPDHERQLQAAGRIPRGRCPPTASRRLPATASTVDYVVRVESGVIDRSIYRFAVLAPGGVPADGWNRRFVFNFGGGCSAGYEQGSRPIGTALTNRRALAGVRDADGQPQRPRHRLQRRPLGRGRADAQGARDRGARRAAGLDDGRREARAARSSSS